MKRTCPSALLLGSSEESPVQFTLNSEIGLCDDYDSDNLDWTKSTEEALSDVTLQCSDPVMASPLPPFRTYLIKREERSSKQSSPCSTRFVRKMQASPRPYRAQFQHRLEFSMNSQRPLAASTEAQSQAESLIRSPKSPQEIDSIPKLSISCDCKVPALSVDLRAPLNPSFLTVRKKSSKSMRSRLLKGSLVKVRSPENRSLCLEPTVTNQPSDEPDQNLSVDLDVSPDASQSYNEKRYMLL